MAVLVIGIGGTGFEVISRAREEAKHIDRSLLRFYYIDSAKKETERFSPEESSFIGGFPINQAVENQWASISSWWYPKSYKPEYLGELGTGKNRLVGRMHFFMHADDIRKDLTKIFNRFSGDSVSVYVVCSLGGGQGSSICVDVAMLCKKILRDQAKIHSVVGVLLDFNVIYSLIDSKINTINTGLAALTEIEYYNLLPSRKSLKKYSFNALSIRERIEIKNETPFNLIFLIQHKNSKGQQFESKEDYFDLMAVGILDLLNLNNNIGSIRNMPGLEIRAESTGIEDFFHDWIDIHAYDGFSAKWGSFGIVEVMLPIEKITQYSKNRLSDEIIGIMLGSISEDEKSKINGFIEGLFDDFGLWESNKKEEMQSKITNILRKEESSLFGSEPEIISRTATAIIKAKDEYQNVIKSKSQLIKDKIYDEDNKRTIERTFESLKTDVLKRLREKKEDLFNTGNINGAVELLESFIHYANAELGDIESHEQAWIKKTNENSIQTTINSTIADIENTKKKIFEKREKYYERLKPKKMALAQYWVENYLRFLFLKTYLKDIETFYSALINEAKKEIYELENFKKKLASIRKEYRYESILSASIDIVDRKSGRSDFVLNICSSENMVSRMVYKEIKNENVIKNIVSKGMANIIENLDKEVESEINEKISNVLDLEKGLEKEAKYFYDELKEKFETLAKYKLEEERKIYKKWIDPDSFDAVYRSYQASKRGEVVNEEDILLELIKGRLKNLFQKFGFPFWSFSKTQILPEHKIEELEDKILLSFDAKMDKINKIVPSVFQTCPTYNDNNPYHMRLFIAKGGMPVYILNQITCFIEREKSRRNYFIKAGKPVSADEMNTQKSDYNDRIFIEDKERAQFSIFITEKEKDIYKYFALSELFSFISPLEGRRSNFRLEVELSPELPRGQNIGRGISDTLETISNNAELYRLLKEKVEAALNKAQASDLQGFEMDIKNLYARYGALLKQSGAKTKEIYRELRKSLTPFIPQK